MYLITMMEWSDVSMGDGNPQTLVALRETMEEARQFVVEMTNEEFGPTNDDDVLTPVTTFEEAVEFLKSAPMTPELDISELVVGDKYKVLSRDILDDHSRTFEGKREIE